VENEFDGELDGEALHLAGLDCVAELHLPCSPRRALMSVYERRAVRRGAASISLPSVMCGETSEDSHSPFPNLRSGRVSDLSI
jgi:hypothetical protein